MTINIFVGTEPKTEIARKVLEYSILKNTKLSKEKILFHPMLGEDWRINPPNGVGTGFSLLRWDIPRRMNYKGHAIYLDADIICLSPVEELFKVDVDFPNKDCSHWCTYQKCKWFDKPTPETSVMFIDCAKAEENQRSMEEILKYLKDDTKRKKYVQVMRALDHKSAPQAIPNRFNRLNSLDPNGKNNFLHYTKEDQQPWYNPSHPFKDIWVPYFVEALKEGVISSSEVQKAIDKFEPHQRGKRGQGMHPYWKKFL